MDRRRFIIPREDPGAEHLQPDCVQRHLSAGPGAHQPGEGSLTRRREAGGHGHLPGGYRLQGQLCAGGAPENQPVCHLDSRHGLASRQARPQHQAALQAVALGQRLRAPVEDEAGLRQLLGIVANLVQ